MFITIVRKLINFFDSFQQKTIISFFKKKNFNNAIIFDVGAHHGESIKFFLDSLSVSEIHAFEASCKNFSILKNKLPHIPNVKIFINKFGLSNTCRNDFLNQVAESSSSTICNINTNSSYYKKKKKILGIFNDIKYQKKIPIYLKTLDKYLSNLCLKKIDILKIDTEGHEYEVLQGASTNISKFKFIYFEHHYDNMIKKNYKFKNIHDLLLNNNFKQVFKSKMVFRKTFEYIYQNIKK